MPFKYTHFLYTDIFKISMLNSKNELIKTKRYIFFLMFTDYTFNVKNVLIQVENFVSDQYCFSFLVVKRK